MTLRSNLPISCSGSHHHARANKIARPQIPKAFSFLNRQDEKDISVLAKIIYQTIFCVLINVNGEKRHFLNQNDPLFHPHSFPSFHDKKQYYWRRFMTNPLTTLPSALPFTCGINFFIIAPLSKGLGASNPNSART